MAPNKKVNFQVGSAMRLQVGKGNEKDGFDDYMLISRSILKSRRTNKTRGEVE